MDNRSTGFRERRTTVPRNRFIDGCHRYGWLIGIIANLLIVGVFAGRLSQSVDDVRERLFRVEQRVDQMLDRK